MEGEQKTDGALIGSIVIVIILIIGGIYLWQIVTKQKVAEQNAASSDLKDLQSAGLNSGSEIETELNNVDLENLDQGI